MTDLELFRVYLEAGRDGYPAEWHQTIKHLVREQAENRCLRCNHPYEKGAGQWSQCDELCKHLGPMRVWTTEGWTPFSPATTEACGPAVYALGDRAQAEWRILTVHHLNGMKLDCRWWNLVALCQRDHLYIQRKVKLDQVFPFEHSEWFKPYAAGFYAHRYLGLDLTREEVMDRLDELLALERAA